MSAGIAVRSNCFACLPCLFTIVTGMYLLLLPIPLAVQPKAWVDGYSLAGIVGSNPAGGMDVSVVCCPTRADHLSRGVVAVRACL